MEKLIDVIVSGCQLVSRAYILQRSLPGARWSRRLPMRA